MISDIKKAADNVGISMFVTNAREKLEVQLNRLTRVEDLPIMLCSWDFDISVDFDKNGLLNNPKISVVCLLLSKPEDTTVAEHEIVAEQMYQIYLSFLQELRIISSSYIRNYQEEPITGISCKLLPRYGAGQHSGVLGRFTMAGEIVNCK